MFAQYMSNMVQYHQIIQLALQQNVDIDFQRYNETIRLYNENIAQIIRLQRQHRTRRNPFGRRADTPVNRADATSRFASASAASSIFPIRSDSTNRFASAIASSMLPARSDATVYTYTAEIPLSTEEPNHEDISGNGVPVITPLQRLVRLLISDMNRPPRMDVDDDDSEIDQEIFRCALEEYIENVNYTGEERERLEQNDCVVCPISLERFEDDERLARIRLCGHTFKQASVINWFLGNHTTCPVCRVDLYQRYVESHNL